MRAGAFLLATAIGTMPMTALYVAAGTSLTASPAAAAIDGLVVVLLVLLLPILVERFDPFNIGTWVARNAHGAADDGTPGTDPTDSDESGE